MSRITGIFAILAAFLGLSSVIIGAAGDHLLEGKLTPDTVETFDVALRYHQLYAILIFCACLYASHTPTSRFFKAALAAWIFGILVFCGSLYASLLTGLAVLTYATPLGGTTLMLGWVLAGIHFAVCGRTSSP